MTWSSADEIPGCVLYRPHLRRTALTAVIVGTVLFCINHLAAVLAGNSATGTWIATGVSYVVPFCVANIGLLAALRVPAGGDPDGVSGAASGPPPTWARRAEIPSCILYRRHLARTVSTALIVGTLYFVINQLPTILAGNATGSNWIESGITYMVPFCVANVGVLVGTRRPRTLAAA